jgi:hypothetical protein
MTEKKSIDKKWMKGFVTGQPKYQRLSPDCHIYHEVTIGPTTELKSTAVSVRFDVKTAYNQVIRSEMFLSITRPPPDT